MRTAIVVALAIALSACASSSGPTSFADRLPSSHPLSELSESVTLRQRYGLRMNPEMPAIYVQSVSVHHTRVLFSTFATRGEDGLWSVRTMGEETSGLLVIEARAIPERTQHLTEEQSRALDRLLASDALYTRSPRSSGTFGVGSPQHIMEIAGSDRRTVVKWNGKLLGAAGQIADIVIGSE